MKLEHYLFRRALQLAAPQGAYDHMALHQLAEAVAASEGVHPEIQALAREVLETSGWGDRWMADHASHDLAWALSGMWSENCCQPCRDAMYATKCGAHWVAPHKDRAGRRTSPGGWVDSAGILHDHPLEATCGTP